jgi:hypothetical protein
MARGNVTQVALAIALVAGLAASAPPTLAEDRGSGSPEDVTVVPERDRDPAVIIHVDPLTGDIVTAPAVPLRLSPSLMNALSTSDQGLAVTLSPVLGGGILLHSHGRFQSPLIGTIDDKQRLHLQHLHEAPGSGASE